MTDWISIMAKVELKESRSDIGKQCWNDLVIWERKSNEGVVKRYISLSIYIRSEL